MPDKHSNNKPEVSEELIRKYLAGELDDRAMHALERQALDDPFLADALEGYAAHEPDQSAHLADLERRLEQRVAQSEKGKLRLLYYRWASAAAILVILGLSFLWINRQQSAERLREVAKVEETRPAPPAYKATTDSGQVARSQPTPPTTLPAETLIAKADAPKVTRTAPAPPAPALMKAAKREANEVAAAAEPETALLEDKGAAAELADVKTLSPAAKAGMEDTLPEKDRQPVANANVAAPSEQALAGRVAGVSVTSDYGKAKKRTVISNARRIVVLGSSTAAGVGPKTSDSTWVSLLLAYVQAKDKQATITNLAVGGFNSYKILPEDADVPFNKPDPDPEHNIDKALSLQPNMIIINMPSNDITAGFSVVEFQRNLARVTDIIRRYKIRYYITTTQPRNTSAANRAKLQQMRDLIIRHYPDAYINCWEGLSAPDGNILPKYDSGDGVHLNGLGHQVMFERVKEKITSP